MATDKIALAPDVEAEEIALRPMASNLEALVREFQTIETEAQYLRSGDLLKQCAEHLKVVDNPDSKIQRAKAGAYLGWQGLCSVLNALRTPAETLAETIKKARLRYERVREDERLEAERQAVAAAADANRRAEAETAEANRRAQELAEIEAWELEEAGAPAAVVELAREMPAYVPAPVQTIAPAMPRSSFVPKQQGIGGREKWTAAVLDVAALGTTERERTNAIALIETGDEAPPAAARAGLLLLVKAVAEGKAPLEALEPNLKFLKSQAKDYKTALAWPGVHIYDAGSVTVRV